MTARSLLRAARRAAAALACLGVAACATAAPGDCGEAEYLRRFRAALAATGGADLPTYAPMEAVPGAARVRPLPMAAPERRGIAPDALAAAQAYAARNNSSVLLVWRDGALEAADYFGATTPETLINARSLAKPLAAIAIGRAIQLGKIRSVDQPVSDFIPEWRGTPKAAMTLRHLLDMRSGLLAQGLSSDPNNPWSRSYLHPEHGRVLVEEYPLTHPPGTRFDYANAVSELVAVVIERATGQRYGAFLSRELFGPLGAAGGEVWVDHVGGLAHSGCCILLPAETYLRTGVLLLQDGVWSGRRLLPEGFVAQMRQGTPQNPHYGMGVYAGRPYAARRGFANPDLGYPGVLHGEPYAADDLFLFDGNANQVLYMIPSLKLAILRLGAPPPKQPEWDNAVLPNTLIRGLGR